MSENPTVIPSLTKEQWTQYCLDVFPIPWTSDLARLPGGNLYAVFHAMAANLKIINDFLIYGFDATLITTATGTALEDAAKDFFGDSLPKKDGESDDAYRIRIEQSLFIPYATKEAFIQAIEALTGIAPRVIDPFNPYETGAYDWSFYDADIPPRSSRYGAPGAKYQGFVIATIPAPSGPEQATAIWGYDAGGAYDFYTGVYWNLKAQDFISQYELDQLILRIKAFGITIWRKYISQGSVPFPIPQSYMVATGLISFPITIQPINSPYRVIASANWLTNFALSSITPTGFTLTPSTPSPSGAILNFVILPVGLPGVGSVPMSAEIDPDFATIPVPQSPSISGNRVAITCSWETTTWITTVGINTLTVEFGTAAPAGAVVSYYFAPPANSGYADITPDSIGWTIPIAELPNCTPFVTPSWNTQVAVTATGTGISMKFGTPAPAGAFIHWSYVPIPG